MANEKFSVDAKIYQLKMIVLFLLCNPIKIDYIHKYANDVKIIQCFFKFPLAYSISVLEYKWLSDVGYSSPTEDWWSYTFIN